MCEINDLLIPFYLKFIEKKTINQANILMDALINNTLV